MENSVSGVAAAMLDYINGWPDKPGSVLLAGFGNALPAMRMMPLPGISELRRYADGTSLYGWPFSISIRARPSFSAGKVIEALTGLSDYICRAELPLLGDTRAALAVEMIGAPERTAVNVSGQIEFTATYRLIYAALPQYV